MTDDRQFHAGQFRIVRCRVNPTRSADSGVAWAILGLGLGLASEGDLNLPDELVDAVVLIGELRAYSETNLVAVTVEVITQYMSSVEDPEWIKDEIVLRAETERIGRRLNDVLYDAAAGVARALVALTGATIDVPTVTPKPKISLWEDSRRARRNDVEQTTTPDALAREIGVSATQVRRALRGLFGPLPEGVSRWELSAEQADALRAHFAAKD